MGSMQVWRYNYTDMILNRSLSKPPRQRSHCRGAWFRLSMCFMQGGRLYISAFHFSFWAKPEKAWPAFNTATVHWRSLVGESVKSWVRGWLVFDPAHLLRRPNGYLPCLFVDQRLLAHRLEPLPPRAPFLLLPFPRLSTPLSMAGELGTRKQHPST